MQSLGDLNTALPPNEREAEHLQSVFRQAALSITALFKQGKKASSKGERLPYSVHLYTPGAAQLTPAPRTLPLLLPLCPMTSTTRPDSVHCRPATGYAGSARVPPGPPGPARSPPAGHIGSRSPLGRRSCRRRPPHQLHLRAYSRLLSSVAISLTRRCPMNRRGKKPSRQKRRITTTRTRPARHPLLLRAAPSRPRRHPCRHCERAWRSRARTRRRARHALPRLRRRLRRPASVRTPSLRRRLRPRRRLHQPSLRPTSARPPLRRSSPSRAAPPHPARRRSNLPRPPRPRPSRTRTPRTTPRRSFITQRAAHRRPSRARTAAGRCTARAPRRAAGRAPSRARRRPSRLPLENLVLAAQTARERARTRGSRWA